MIKREWEWVNGVRIGMEWKREKEYGVQIEEDLVWSKTSPKTMVQEV